MIFLKIKHQMNKNQVAIADKLRLQKRNPYGRLRKQIVLDHA
jgi:hypothetical protein